MISDLNKKIKEAGFKLETDHLGGTVVRDQRGRLLAEYDKRTATLAFTPRGAEHKHLADEAMKLGMRVTLPKQDRINRAQGFYHTQGAPEYLKTGTFGNNKTSIEYDYTAKLATITTTQADIAWKLRLALEYTRQAHMKLIARPAFRVTLPLSLCNPVMDVVLTVVAGNAKD